MRESISNELRRLIFEQANYACEYCYFPEAFEILPHQIDHIIAVKHRGKSTHHNLACSCTTCNLNKGSDIASIDKDSGLLTPLFNPRTQNWSTHFYWDDAFIIPITAIGRVTEHVLQLNKLSRVDERAFWMSLGLYY